MYRVQVWWGDEWSYGMEWRTRHQADSHAEDLRKLGWRVRVVKMRRGVIVAMLSEDESRKDD